MLKQISELPAQVQHRLATIHVLTQAELKRLLAVITELRHQALFLIAYRHGLRASEVSLLQKGDLDFSCTTINIQRMSRDTKDRHALQKDEAAALRRYLKSRSDDSITLFLSAQGRPLSRRGLDWLMKTYAGQAKLPRRKRHFHVLKHSVATHLLSSGAELSYVHEWLGHTSWQSTTLYLYLASASRRSSQGII